MTTTPPGGEMRQIVVHPAVWPRLEAWLKQSGINLCPLPLDDDDLPTYVMQPSAALMNAAMKEQQ